MKLEIKIGPVLCHSGSSLTHFLLFILLLLLPAACEKPVPPEPEDLPDAVQLIDEDIRQFMGRFGVTGLSLAVTKSGRLVYARGYGLADAAAEEKVDTAHLMRIASLSKFITATGIMKLIEQGQLHMDDRVFGEGSVLGTEYGTQPYRQYVTDITIKHLLHHEAGGWSNKGSDPTFQNSYMTMDQLLTWALDERPLTSQPGTKYEYSNLGYQILGKVIEKKSGMSYEQFMRANVLVPSGVTNMQIGGSTSAERKPGEARYYSEGGSVYSHTPGIIQRLGSAGGWIASPIDLLRVMTHIDGFSSVPDILNPPTIQLLTTRSVLSGYACGLHVNTNGNWWHSGSLTGTRAWIVRSASGYCWAILMNKSCSHSEFDTALDNLIWTAIRTPDAVWPETDLF